MPYIEAARSIGASDTRLMTRHVFPNVTTPILVLSTLGIASAILIGASLSFLGLGAQPPTAEWGAILNQGRQYMRHAWWMNSRVSRSPLLSCRPTCLVTDLPTHLIHA